MSRAEIRPFDPSSDADYEAIVAILNTANPEYPTTAADQKEWDAKREARVNFGRWIALVDGRPVGVASHDQMPWQYHPRRYYLDLMVLPEYQGQGIGRALYEHVLAAIEPSEPLSVKTMVREDWERAVRFYTDRGFREILRAHESRLYLASFDMAKFATDIHRPVEHGIVLKSLADLWGDPDLSRKLHALDTELLADLPAAEPITPLTPEQFDKMVMHSSNLLKEAYAVAVDEKTGEFVGVNALWKRKADNDLDNGLTGVRRAYRRKGIALALKLKNIAWAKSHGYRAIRTDNEVNNVGMLSINERLGFQRVPPWLEISKTLRPDEDEAESATA